MNYLILAVAAVVLLGIIGALAVRTLGGNIRLVSNWKLTFEYYSTYALSLLAFWPEIWNELVRLDLFGGGGDEVSFWYSIVNKAGALFTLIVLKVNQTDKPKKPDFNGEGNPPLR